VVEATDAGTDGADGRIAARMRHETTWEGNGVWDRYPALYHKSEKDFNGSLDLSVECVCVYAIDARVTGKLWAWRWS